MELERLTPPPTKFAHAGLKRPGLMATAYTMEQDFYVGRLRDKFGFDVIVPDEADRRETHRIIYDELCKGIRHRAITQIL